MASIEQLVVRLRQALASMGDSALAEAEQALGEAKLAMQKAADGSVDDAPTEFGMLIRLAEDLLVEVRRLRQSIVAGVEQVIVGLLAATTSSTLSTSAGDRSLSPPVPAVGARRIAEVTAQLPPPVDHPPPRGQPWTRTHGRLLDDTGGVSAGLVSGSDEDSLAARGAFAELGLPPVAIETHVEVKAVMRMRQAGREHATLVVNNTPCPGPLGCDRLLPVLLAPGQTLTVHWPGGQSRTYTGRRKRS